MMPEELPDCPRCHGPANGFQPGSCHGGPSYLVQGFRCACGVHAHYSRRECGHNVLVYFRPEQLTPTDNAGHLSFPDVYVDWMNDVVLPEWRYRVRHKIDVSVPPKAPESLCVYVHMQIDSDDPQWVFVGASLQKASMSMEVHEDPILTDARASFGRVFPRLAAALGVSEVQTVEISNRYLSPGTKGVPPWVEFQMGSSTFRVGQRKRVVAIQVDTPEGLSTVDIEPLAEGDKVTFVVLGKPMHIKTREAYQDYLQRVLQVDIDRGLCTASIKQIQSMLDRFVREFDEEEGKDVTDLVVPGIAHHLEVHAWTEDKLVEYLTVLCRAALEETKDAP